MCSVDPADIWWFFVVSKCLLYKGLTQLHFGSNPVLPEDVIDIKFIDGIMEDSSA